MTKKIIVKSQAEFDACIESGNIPIVIDCQVVAGGNANVEARDNAKVVARENASVMAWDNAKVVARDNAKVVARENAKVEAEGNASVKARENAKVVAWGNAKVEAWGNANVEARDNANVEARENAKVVAWGNAKVEAWGNASVKARDNAKVVAWDNAKVEAWGNANVEARENANVEARENAKVEAWDNASVVAWGNVFIRLFSALKIKASSYVVIMKHNNNMAIEGGRQLEVAPEPKTGKEFCEFNGLSLDVSYKIDNIDSRIFEAIELGKSKLAMHSWHGEKCDADNWCQTTHCRAGFAICLAGKEGFALEKKYGAELAGKMIYAVSRPDKELPNFFASDEEVMNELRVAHTEFLNNQPR